MTRHYRLDPATRKVPATPGLYGALALLAFPVSCVHSRGRPPTPPPPAGTAAANSSGMRFVFVPPGEFDMGSPEDEKGRKEDERLHRVRITRGFFLGVTEVTQEEWRRVMGTERAAFARGDFPANPAAFDDAILFCERLSRLDGRRHRLPTEAEWEYACRAGTRGPFSGTGILDEMGWHGGSAGERPHPVARKRPNDFGLHDMHGNVWEWTADWHGDYFSAALPGLFPGAPPPAVFVDPAGPVEGEGRAQRGGSWVTSGESCRSAAREWNVLDHRNPDQGFRVAREYE